MERRKLPGTSRKLRLRSLSDLDGRTAAAKAAFQLRDEIAADLGGMQHLTAAQQTLISNVALLGAALSDMSARYLAGDGADLSLYCTIANSQRRLLADLGLERRVQETSTTLQEYVRGKRA